MHRISRRSVFIAGLAAPWIVTAKTPEPGVTDNAIVFGQTIGYDSVWGSLYKNYSDGLLAAFKQANAEGGIHGRQLSLVRKEDNYVTDKALDNIRDFARSNEVFGLACIGGTGITLAAMPLLAEFKLPTVGTLTGADGARPYNRYLFHTRTAYSNEVEKMVEHLSTIGIHRIAAVYQDNAFGKSVLAAAEKAAPRYKTELAAKVPHPVDKWDAKAMADALHKAAPQAVLLFTSPATAADLMKTYHEMTKVALASPWVLSVTSVPKMFELLGPDIRGIAMTQVMPHPLSGSSRVSRQFRATMSQFGTKDNMTYEAVEGYMTGRVILEALRRAGRNLTRESYVRTLESFSDLKLEDMHYRYTRAGHPGPNFVEVTILGADGAVLR
jgi:branched-chain amino acid transport system substrate-binding protein